MGSFQQTDTTALCGAIAGCSGQLVAPSAVAKNARDGGVAGTATHTITIQPGGQEVGSCWEIDPEAAWTLAAGTWTIPINITAGSVNLNIQQAYVCLLSAACANLGTIGSALALGINLLTTGVKTINVTGTAPANAPRDKYYIILVVENISEVLPFNYSYKSDQILTVPGSYASASFPRPPSNKQEVARRKRVFVTR